MCEAPPTSMLARLSVLGAELAACAQQHRDAPLAEQEHAVLELVRAALPDLLGAVLQLSLSSLDSRRSRVPAHCPGCGGKARVQGWRARQVSTVCGTVRFERPWCICPACGQGWSPAEAGLHLSRCARLSAWLDHWVTQVCPYQIGRTARRAIARTC